MATFDSWEAAVHPPEDYLMHFRTKGSKNGVRRYQNEDGTWTELGLEERRAREGWGETKKARRLQRKMDRIEKRKVRKAAKADARAKRAEVRAKRNVKNLTDAELKKRIERLKMEDEYRKLNRNPVIETGAKLINGYFKMKNDRIEREYKRYKMENERLTARKDLINAKARKAEARNEFIDTVLPGSKGKNNARANFLKAKNDRSKNTIRGAISSTVGNMIRKAGSNFVKDMPEHSMLISGAKKVGKAAKKVGRTVEKVVNNDDVYVKNMLGTYKKPKKKKKAPDNPLKG